MSSPAEGAVARVAESADDEAVSKALHDAEFQDFAESTYQTVKGIVSAWCWDRQMVEDALHEAYLEGRVQWPKIRTYRKPIAWVIKTARFKVRHEYRRLERQAGTAPQDLPSTAQADPADDWEAQQLLWDLLRRIPPRHAEVFVMSQEGFTNHDIARILGLAEMSVRSYKAAAIKRLKELAGEDEEGDSEAR